MGNNRKFNVSGIFCGVSLISYGGKLATIEVSTPSPHGNQLLPLATSQVLCNNSIFSPVQLSVGGGQLITLEDPSLNTLGYQLLQLATSKLVDDNREFDIVSIFSPI